MLKPLLSLRGARVPQATRVHPHARPSASSPPPVSARSPRRAGPAGSGAPARSASGEPTGLPVVVCGAEATWPGDRGTPRVRRVLVGPGSSAAPARVSAGVRAQAALTGRLPRYRGAGSIVAEGLVSAARRHPVAAGPLSSECSLGPRRRLAERLGQRTRPGAAAGTNHRRRCRRIASPRSPAEEPGSRSQGSPRAKADREDSTARLSPVPHRAQVADLVPRCSAVDLPRCAMLDPAWFISAARPPSPARRGGRRSDARRSHPHP